MFFISKIISTFHLSIGNFPSCWLLLNTITEFSVFENYYFMKVRLYSINYISNPKNTFTNHPIPNDIVATPSDIAAISKNLFLKL